MGLGNITEMQNFTQMESHLGQIDTLLLGGGEAIITGLVVFAILLIFAYKGRLSLDAAIAIFVPGVIIFAKAAYFPQAVEWFAWIIAFTIWGLVISKLKGG